MRIATNIEVWEILYPGCSGVLGDLELPRLASSQEDSEPEVDGAGGTERSMKC